MGATLKNLVRDLVPKPILRALYPLTLKRKAARLGLRFRTTGAFIDITRGTDTLRIAAGHTIYLGDALDEFDFLFSGVRPLKLGDGHFVDYSTPRYHDVVGFEAYPILFPGFAEPVVTTRQYLGFAGLQEGMTVLDLGAYSGLTSMLFAQATGASGLVVAVEADRISAECVKVNLANFARYCPSPIRLLEGAVWKDNTGVEFSCEGNMGASAVPIVGGNRGAVVKVPSYTLSAIADACGLSRVDFIKCDVEGAENVVFTDRAFFARFSPRIIIETHFVDGVETTAKCVADLEAVGYACRKVAQDGWDLPLLECSPPAR
jgi:FkbM family methyltransferase